MKATVYCKNVWRRLQSKIKYIFATNKHFPYVLVFKPMKPELPTFRLCYLATAPLVLVYEILTSTK